MPYDDLTAAMRLVLSDGAPPETPINFPATAPVDANRGLSIEDGAPCGFKASLRDEGGDEVLPAAGQRVGLLVARQYPATEPVEVEGTVEDEGYVYLSFVIPAGAMSRDERATGRTFYHARAFIETVGVPGSRVYYPALAAPLVIEVVGPASNREADQAAAFATQAAASRDAAADRAAEASEDRAAALAHATEVSNHAVVVASDRVAVEAMASTIIGGGVPGAMVAPAADEIINPAPSDARPLAPVWTGSATKGLDILVMGGGTVPAERHGLGRGVDAKTALLSAVAEAAAAGSGQRVLLPDGDFTLAMGTGFIDLSGIAALEARDTTLRFTSGPATGVIQTNGTATQVVSNLSVERGQWEITVPDGLGFVVGERIVFVSTEPVPFAGRSYYQRGEAAYVAEYTSIGSGQAVLRLHRPLRFTYHTGTYFFPAFETYAEATLAFTGAAIWRISETTLSLSGGLHIVGSTGATHGIVATHARLDIGGVQVTGFYNRGLGARVCTGTVSGATVVASRVGSGDNYAFAAGDFVDMTLDACTMEGGQHAVACGGGTVFTSAGCGTVNGVVGGVGMPGILRITSGTYACRADGYAGIDAHGGWDTLSVSGATVWGGLTPNALTNIISGCHITHYSTAGVTLVGVQTTPQYAVSGEKGLTLDVTGCAFEAVAQKEVIGATTQYSARTAAFDIRQGVYSRISVKATTVTGHYEQGATGNEYRTFWYSYGSAEVRGLDVDITVDLTGSSSLAHIVSHAPHTRLRLRGTGARTRLSLYGGGRTAPVFSTTSDAECDVQMDATGWTQSAPVASISGLFEIIGGALSTNRLHLLNAPWHAAYLGTLETSVTGKIRGSGKRNEGSDYNRAALLLASASTTLQDLDASGTLGGTDTQDGLFYCSDYVVGGVSQPHEVRMVNVDMARMRRGDLTTGTRAWASGYVFANPVTGSVTLREGVRTPTGTYAASLSPVATHAHAWTEISGRPTMPRFGSVNDFTRTGTNGRTTLWTGQPSTPLVADAGGVSTTSGAADLGSFPYTLTATVAVGAETHAAGIAFGTDSAGAATGARVYAALNGGIFRMWFNNIAGGSLGASQILAAPSDGATVTIVAVVTATGATITSTPLGGASVVRTLTFSVTTTNMAPYAGNGGRVKALGIA